MNFDFIGKRALVTGAGKGLGRGVALKLAECGANVVAVSRTQEDLDSLQKQVPNVETHVVDLTNWDVARQLVESLGPIDLLVNSAGTSDPQMFLDVTKESLDSVFDINYKAVYNVTQVVARGMVDRGKGGSIVMMSSVFGLVASETRSVYCCTKAALDQLTGCLAVELGPHKVRVNSINSTVVLTPRTIRHGWDNPTKASTITDETPLGRIAEIEDIVNTTLFLLSDKASMITGSLVPVDGGLITHL